MIYTKQQNEALSAIADFIGNNGQIFILKGYAGTGKTTIVKPVIEEATNAGKEVYLLAPTGRAAKILSEKTNVQARTIHSQIYGNPKVVLETGNELTESKVFYNFGIREPEDYVPEQTLLIVDEASMVSSRKVVDEMLVFGTGVLMDDMLTFARLHNGAKILFIGDPAQLPPVGDSKSCALDKSFFEGKGYKVSEYELTDVVRQASDSAILSNSIILRGLINEEYPKSLSLQEKEDEIETIQYNSVPDIFCETAPVPSLAAPVVICFSNESAYTYNQLIRDRYFPNINSVAVGDRLIVTVNTRTPMRPVLNGEFAMVTTVSESVEELQGFAYIEDNGTQNKKKVVVNLRFRDVTLLFDDGKEVSVKIHEDYLNSPQKRLTYVQMCGLVSNFRIRHPELKKGTKEYADALSKDPYFNALCVKYGYAITCHKAQGGEWDTAFVDYSGRVGLNKDCLRWCYTASTRAKKKMYTTGLPYIPAFRAKVMPVKAVSRIPAEFYPTNAVIECGPYHSESHSAPIKALYWQVYNALQGSGYSVRNIEHKPYREIYSIIDSEGAIYRYDFVYNGSYIFTSISSQTPSAPSEILKMIQEEPEVTYPFYYSPSQESFGELYSKIVSLSDENSIRLVNVVEHPENYRIDVYMKTEKGPAYLEIIHKKSGIISYIVPCATNADDYQLNKLVEGIKE